MEVSVRNKPQKKAAKAPERPLRSRLDTVLIKPVQGMSYAFILRALKKRVNPDELGATVQGISRETRSKELLVGLRCSKEGRGKLDAALKKAIGASGSVCHLIPRIEVKIADLESSIEAEDAKEAVRGFCEQGPPKCELPKVIIRHDIGLISAAKSRLLLLGQCHCLHQSSAGPTTASFFHCLNLPTFSRNLAQYRPYTKPTVIFTMASSSESRSARIGLMDGTLLGHVSFLPRQTILEVRKPKFGIALARFCAENKCCTEKELGSLLARDNGVTRPECACV